MRHVFLIEDDLISFLDYKESYEALGYNVYPENYEVLDDFESLDTLCQHICYKIIFDSVDLLSIDLNLNDLMNLNINTQYTDEADHPGIQLIKMLTSQKLYILRTIPILIVSMFDENEIERFHKTSRYILDYIYKDDLETRTELSDKPLTKYIENYVTKKKIDRSIDQYHIHSELAFKSAFGEESSSVKRDKLLTAFKEKKLFAFIQQIVDSDKVIKKYEVLCRLNSEDNMDSFFPYVNAAKFYGLLPYITKEMIIQSFKMIKDTLHQISINLDDEDLQEDKIKDLINFLAEQVKYNGLDKRQITLEILEGAKQDDYIVDSVKQLKAEGYQIAIDDFGKENSNFERLKLLIENSCIDYIKLDGILIKDIHENKISEDIVRSVISIASNNNIKTVAEYVHNEAVFNKLKELNIDLFQGYYFHQPENIAMLE